MKLNLEKIAQEAFIDELRKLADARFRPFNGDFDAQGNAWGTIPPAQRNLQPRFAQPQQVAARAPDVMTDTRQMTQNFLTQNPNHPQSIAFKNMMNAPVLPKTEAFTKQQLFGGIKNIMKPVSGLMKVR